jgi:O-antigen/teichoic acid export membrane protein
LLAALAGWTTTALLLWLTLAQQTGLALDFRFPVFRSSLAYAGKAYVAGIFAYLVLRTNVFLLEHFHGQAAVGHYSVAVYLFEALTLVPLSLAMILFPRLVQDEDGRWPLVQRALLVCAALMFACCLLCAALARPLIALAFGAAYLPALPIVYCILPAAFCYGLISVLSQYLSAEGFPRLQVAIWVAACLLAVAFGVVLIPIHGGAGAAAALSIVLLAVLVLQMLLACSLHTRLAPVRRTGWGASLAWMSGRGVAHCPPRSANRG